MLDESTGVTAGASTAADSSASVDTGGQEAINPTVQDGLSTPAQPVAENVSGADAGVEGMLTEEELAQAPEQWRDKFKSLLGGYKSLEADHKPIKSWVEQRGGMETIQSDVQMVDQLFSADLETRRQGYQYFRQQDPAAFDRLVTDVIETPWVQDRFLQAINPQALLQYVQDAGLLPEGSEVDLSVAASIPNEWQQVWNSLPAAVRADYSKMTPELRNWNLRREAQIYNSQQAERQRAQQERTQAIQQQKTRVYNDVRSIIQSSLAEKIPGSSEATQFVLDVTESAMLNDAECSALWNELTNHIENGEMRAVREKMPLLVAKAKAMATQKATWLNERESKARQFDELMRMASQEEILAYVNRMRGGQKQPGPGSTPAPTNGAVPRPDAVGQYDRANILSYHPAHRQ